MKFGNFEVFLIEDGAFKLDGGAMFGVVPKVMWQKLEAADTNNRILLHANCVLVKTGDANILIDTGLGGKWDDKKRDMFSVDVPRLLVTELLRVDLKVEDITHVVFSHLHFDHAGGGTFIDKDGQLKVQFPNAKYYAQKGEWEIARNPSVRDRASYLPENLDPIEESGKLVLVDGEEEILPGIKMRISGGHTKHHSIIQVESEGNTLVFLADLIPTASHIQAPYVMGYDLYPGDTMKYKEEFLQEAAEKNYLLVFEHGPVVKAGHVEKGDRGKWRLNKFDMETIDYDAEVKRTKEE